MKKDPRIMLNIIAQVIFDKKGFNILALDVRGISTITDFLLIAEGNVDRHVTSLAESITGELKDRGEKPFRVEGIKTGDWVVLDYVDIMVHLFMPGMREKYQLEKLWNEGKIVDLDIDISDKRMAEGNK